MSKHTPGPWSVMRTPSGYDHIRGPKGQRISHECSDLDDLGDEAKANATLIAAAPDLLAALKKIANGEGYYGAQAREYKEIAAIAIAKAEGK
jgi:hypothetical protein